MNKKIIALFCVVILMVSVFAACSKTKLYTATINGVERPVVTNEDGELVTNADGEVAVYVTNAKGELVTADDGTPNVNYVTNNSMLVHPNGTITYEIFTYPVIEGWSVSDKNGRIDKDGTELKCYIVAGYAATATEENSFNAIMDNVIVQNRTIVDKINGGYGKDQGFDKAEMNTEEIEFAGYEAMHMSYTFYDADGKVVHHAENIYFVIPDGTVYGVDYACQDGVGYDKNFNFLEWAQNNVTVKLPTKK